MDKKNPLFLAVWRAVWIVLDGKKCINGGTGGIRTLGTNYLVRRFSKPLP